MSTPFTRLFKPHVFGVYKCKKVQICMTECILIKGFKQSLPHSVSVSLMLGCEVVFLEHNFDSCQARVGDTEQCQR